MVAFLLPLAGVLISTLLTYYCVKWMLARIQFYRVIDKLPGPPAKPIFGNTFEFKLDKIGKSFSLGHACIDALLEPSYGLTNGS